MKTLGLIGGMSWHSSAVYYKLINQQIFERLGGSHSAKLILYSIDYHDYKALQEGNNWTHLELMLSDAADKLEQAGVDSVMLCSNTPHMIADKLRMKLRVPFIHIAEVTAKEIVKDGYVKVGLLGTNFTMENNFFKDKLQESGIEMLVPNKEDRFLIHEAIVSQLALGVFTKATKEMYLNIMEKLINEGAQAIILGCTEIGILLNQSDFHAKLYDTTLIHAKAAVDFAISD